MTDDYLYEQNFFIDNKVKVEKRIRYNFWMALGDVGGLHDGLYIILSVIIMPIAATLFENDLLKDNLYKQQAPSSSSTGSSELIEFMQSLRAVKLSIWVSIFDCLMRGIKRSRRQREVLRLQKRYL